MEKLILKIPRSKSTIDLKPHNEKTIKLKNLKWVKFNDGLYMSEMSSLINVFFPYTNFNHIFKKVFFIRKDREKSYYISTSDKEEEFFNDINPIFSLKVAKEICQNIAYDLYDMEYGSKFYIE